MSNVPTRKSYVPFMDGLPGIPGQENIDYTAPPPPEYYNQMASNRDSGLVDLLSKINSTGSSNPVTVDDVSNYDFGLSPDELQAYNQSQEQFKPVSEPLGVHDYYPNQGDPIGVGQSSGRIIGTQTQYVPNGGLVPIGMWDARDAAIQKAAMAKAKDVADWKAKNAKAPTSKLTNINENITKEFFNHQDSAWKQAMKASGGDANKAKFLLENNQDYQAKNKSFYDSAKMGDAVVEQDIQIANDLKSGKMVETPAMAEARQKLHLSLNPENPEFKDLAGRYTAFQAVKEYNDSYNTVLDKMTREHLASSGIDESNPDYINEYKSTREYMRDDQKQAIEDNLNTLYKGRGDDFYTPEFIRKDVWGRNAGVRQTKSDNAQFRPKDNEGEVEDLDINNISNEKGSLLGTVAGTGKDASGKYGGADKSGTYTQLDGLTLQKPVKVVIPASADVTDMTTGRHRKDKAVRNAVIGGIYNGYTYNGQLLDDEGLSKLSDAAKKNVKVTPMATVIFNEQKKLSSGKMEDVETTGHLPLEQVKNPILGKNKKNEDFFDKYNKKAEERTAELHKTKEATNTANYDPSSYIPEASKEDWISAGWSDDQIQKAVKSGKIKVK